MLTVTQAAGNRLAQKLVNAQAPDGAALRFVRKHKREGRRLGLRVDKERPGDVAFTYDDRIVLVTDEDVSKLLAGRTLDVKDSGAGPRLKLL